MFEINCYRWHTDFKNHTIKTHLRCNPVIDESMCKEIYDDLIAQYKKEFEDNGIFVLVKMYEKQTKIDAGDYGILITIDSMLEYKPEGLQDDEDTF